MSSGNRIDATAPCQSPAMDSSLGGGAHSGPDTSCVKAPLSRSISPGHDPEMDMTLRIAIEQSSSDNQVPQPTESDTIAFPSRDSPAFLPQSAHTESWFSTCSPRSEVMSEEEVGLSLGHQTDNPHKCSDRGMNDSEDEELLCTLVLPTPYLSRGLRDNSTNILNQGSVLRPMLPPT